MAEALPLKGDIAIDIGAHDGAYTLALVNRFQWVVSFEPAPKLYQLLLENTVGIPNVQRIHAAAFSHTGLLRLGIFSSDMSASSYELPGVTTRGYRVEEMVTGCIRLDDVLLPAGKVDLVKIDTEGAEVEILRGAESLITNHHPLFLIEYHENKEEVTSVLLSHGYVVEDLGSYYLEGEEFYGKYGWLRCWHEAASS